MNKSIKKPALIIFSIVLVALVVAGVYLQKPKTTAMAFQGLVTKVEGNTVFVSGAYVDANGKPVSSEGKQKLIDVQISVTNNTTFQKTVVHKPTKEELVKTKGIWDMKNLKTETQAGKLSDLAANNVQGLTITATAAKNIYKKTQFEAASIKYQDLVY